MCVVCTVSWCVRCMLGTCCGTAAVPSCSKAARPAGLCKRRCAYHCDSSFKLSAARCKMDQKACITASVGCTARYIDWASKLRQQGAGESRASRKWVEEQQCGQRVRARHTVRSATPSNNVNGSSRQQQLLQAALLLAAAAAAVLRRMGRLPAELHATAPAGWRVSCSSGSSFPAAAGRWRLWAPAASGSKELALQASGLINLAAKQSVHSTPSAGGSLTHGALQQLGG